MNNLIAEIIETVKQWDGVDYAVTEDGLIYSALEMELGQISGDGLVIVPFTPIISERLVKGGNIPDNRLQDNPGCLAFQVRDYVDTEQAIWLFRLSYLHKMITLYRRSKNKGRSVQLQRALIEISQDDDLRALIG